MLRVPGSGKSLLEAKAGGADIRILYSPLEAVKIAALNPEREVVFFAVGFETTAPANALSVLHAERMGVTNYSILASPRAGTARNSGGDDDPESRIQAFLGGRSCLYNYGYW